MTLSRSSLGTNFSDLAKVDTPPGLIQTTPVVMPIDFMTPHRRADEPVPCQAAVIQFQTTLLLSDYSEFYGSASTNTSAVTYTALRDGSLIAPPLRHEFLIVAANLVLSGIFLLIAIRNAIVSASFIWRIKIKKKGLFYALFASQFLGLVMLCVKLYSTFRPETNCATTGAVMEVLDGVASGLIMTGIFGLKAYRCLNDSWLALSVVSLLQVAITALLLVDTFHLAESIRNLSGICVRVNGLGFLPYVLILIFIQSCFVLGCLILAVWKSSRLLAAQGRLSYRLSNHESKNEDTTSSLGGAVVRPQKPRGWWDYVPPPTNAESSRQPVVTHTSLNAKNGGVFSVLKGLFMEATPVEPPRKPSLHSEYPIPAQTGRSRSRSNASQAASPRPGLLVPHRRINIKPRVLLFREVMRDELCYTTAVSAAWVASAIMALVGVAHPMFIDDDNWLSLNFAVISLLACHSLGRAVVRNEQEAIFRDSRLWDPKLLPDREAINRRNEGGRGGEGRGSPVFTLSSRVDDKSTRGMLESSHAEHRQSGESWNSTHAFFPRVDGDHGRRGRSDSGSSHEDFIPDSPAVDPYRASSSFASSAPALDVSTMDIIIEHPRSSVVEHPVTSPYTQNIPVSPGLSQSTNEDSDPFGTPRAY